MTQTNASPKNLTHGEVITNLLGDMHWNFTTYLKSPKVLTMSSFILAHTHTYIQQSSRWWWWQWFYIHIHLLADAKFYICGRHTNFQDASEHVKLVTSMSYLFLKEWWQTYHTFWKGWMARVPQRQPPYESLVIITCSSEIIMLASQRIRLLGNCW